MTEERKAGLDEKYCTSCGAVIKKAAELCPVAGFAKCLLPFRRLHQRIVLQQVCSQYSLGDWVFTSFIWEKPVQAVCTFFSAGHSFRL